MRTVKTKTKNLLGGGGGGIGRKRLYRKPVHKSLQEMFLDKTD
jgi:hypothetical protein